MIARPEPEACGEKAAMFQFALDILLGFGIGLSLGLLGGGGSILTVPALVYLVGQSPQAAVTASLVIVGANSAMGAFMHRTQGTLNWRVALIFATSRPCWGIPPQSPPSITRRLRSPTSTR